METSLNVEQLVKDVVKFHHMPIIPDWKAIPTIGEMTYQTLKFHRAPLVDILAVLEAVTISLKNKVHEHVSDIGNGWDLKTITFFGNRLLAIEGLLEDAGNNLLLENDMDGAEACMWPVFTLVTEVWNELFGKGVV